MNPKPLRLEGRRSERAKAGAQEWKFELKVQSAEASY